jgi:hypothetical protein
LESLKIKNCPISDINSHYLPEAYYLELEDEDASEDLGLVLLESDSHNLTIINCPSFTSHTIDEMSQGSDAADWSCPNLTGLSIIGESSSDRISLVSIKNLINCRRIQVEMLRDEDPETPFLNGLDEHAMIEYLKLEGFQNIDDADRKWLKDNVDTLYIYPSIIKRSS